MHVSQSTIALLPTVLNLYDTHIKLQVKCSPESLQEELGCSTDNFEGLNEIEEKGLAKKTKKTFLEMLMNGEIDFEKESDLVA